MDLNSSITDLPKVGPILSKKLEKLGIRTINDLFYHVPSRYLDYSQITTIKGLRLGETVTIHAKIISIANIFSKKGRRMQIGSVEDSTGKLMVIWFNQPFLTKMLYPGRLVSLSGKVGFFNRKLCLTSPDYEIMEEEDGETYHTGKLVPLYPETAGLSSKWLRTLVRNAYQDPSMEIRDFLPKDILKRENLVDLKTALSLVHFPQKEVDALQGRERLGFNELLNLQLKSEYRKLNWKQNKVKYRLKIDGSALNSFIKSLPYELTDSQGIAIEEIVSDLEKPTPMNRLLEGDVGSGKTVVAAAGAFAAFVNGYQSLIMAPTQILANQHYETLKKIFEPFNVRVSLLTSASKKMELGRTDIFVGTHALIHSKVSFDKVAFVVIDEQHRFGVEQRAHLAKKSGTPHVLTMTATPIPRTVALTTYGDLNLSILKESPKGRQVVTTWVVPEQKRKGAYAWVEKQIKETASQVFVVCPLIEDSESETLTDVKSVTSEYEKLKRVFRDRKLGLLHGRMKVKEKDQVLSDFKNKKTDILVATPVVEVGIDIPNATIMIIEAAERFGLAQLHQLRGRVGRGTQKSYCLLFSNIKYSKRLKAMEKTHSGFELAEIDLELRGPGEIFGTMQSGFSELKIAAWNDHKLIKRIKDLADEIVKDPDKYPQITEQLSNASLI